MRLLRPLPRTALPVAGTACSWSRTSGFAARRSWILRAAAVAAAAVEPRASSPSLQLPRRHPTRHSTLHQLMWPAHESARLWVFAWPALPPQTGSRPLPQAALPGAMGAAGCRCCGSCWNWRHWHRWPCCLPGHGWGPQLEPLAWPQCWHSLGVHVRGPAPSPPGPQLLLWLLLALGQLKLLPHQRCTPPQRLRCVPRARLQQSGLSPCLAMGQLSLLLGWQCQNFHCPSPVKAVLTTKVVTSPRELPGKVTEGPRALACLPCRHPEWS
mmetsp:Transcript_2161/g.4933  ORF Transcript_2161/g.4933 Transcript_2161/m.4933 type:complete len:269 (+) Transcript_2161:1527-2333(+)